MVLEENQKGGGNQHNSLIDFSSEESAVDVIFKETLNLLNILASLTYLQHVHNILVCRGVGRGRG